jgi:hypothetical protein
MYEPSAARPSIKKNPSSRRLSVSPSSARHALPAELSPQTGEL